MLSSNNSVNSRKNISQQRQGKQKNSSVTDVFNGFFLKTIHLKFYLSKMNSTSTGHMLVYSNSILTKLRSFQQERFCDSQEQADFFWFNPMLISVFVVECFRYNQNCVFLYQKQTAFTAYVLPEIVFSKLLLLCPKLCCFFSILKVVCFLSGQSIFELYSFKYVQKNSVYLDIKCRSFLFCPEQC